MSVILANEEIVSFHLAALEKNLYREAELKNLFSNPELRETLFDDNKLPRFKLISDMLYNWARNNGFESTFAKISRLVPAKTFQNMLQAGMLFKDSGVPILHGEWTHFIQWYILIEENKRNPYLKNNPQDLFRLLGNDRAKAQTSTNIPFNTMQTIWGLIFDRLFTKESTKKDEQDYRIPENLQMKMLEDKYPILKSGLSKRQQKIRFGLNKQAESDISYKERTPNKIIKK
jgi:hypothetical protein